MYRLPILRLDSVDPFVRLLRILVGWRIYRNNLDFEYAFVHVGRCPGVLSGLGGFGRQPAE